MNLKDLVIPNGVTSFVEYAFQGCSGLTSVSIPNSVTSIGKYAFRDCSGLTAVSIPSSVTSIDQGAFYGCNNIEKLEIDCAEIGSWFSGFATLKDIVFGNSVTSIGSGAFRRCSGLISVSIPNSVTSISEYAFGDCSSLTSVSIPCSVTSIRKDAFSGCYSLTSVYITDLAAWCKISFGDNPLSYAHHLYLNDEEIKDLVIPNSVTSIGKYAFSGCSGLTAVNIPSSVTSIGEYAFQYCTNLSSATINAKADIRESSFSGCSKLTSVVIGNDVTSIGRRAFYECERLESLIIGDCVWTIGSEAFRECKGILKITSLSPIPPKIENENAFEGITYRHAKLRVPLGSMERYWAYEYWENFSYVEEADVTGIEQVLLKEGDLSIDGDIDVYTLDGERKTMKVSQLKSLQRGIYVINGKKYYVR